MAESSPAPLAVDENDVHDRDSCLGDDIDSYTTSLRSSLLENIRENGRGYHKYKEGKYVVPNDEDEMDRLDLQHHLYLLTAKDRLSVAPLPEKLRHVLDVGTGTGIWAIDFADEHPEAQVVGVDLSAIQPSMVPPNLKFEIDDCEEHWTFSQQFDYIHSRGMLGSLRDWPAFVTQCFESLEPGGWLELQEASLPAVADDDSFPDTSQYHRWNTLMLEAADQAGRPLSVAPQLKQWMIDAGFTEVTDVRYKWPQNPWPDDPEMKKLGAWQLVNLLEGIQAFSIALFTRCLGMSPVEAEVLLAGVRHELRDPSFHTYWPVLYVYGKKPEK